MKIVRAFTLAATAALFTGAAGAQTVGVGTGPQGSLTYRIGSGIAKVASDVLGLQSIVQPYSGNQQHIALVTRGRLQFGVNNIQETGAAMNGTDQFADQGPNAEFRVVARLIPIPVGLMVRADSGIEKIADLAGMRVPTGYTSQATVVPVVEALLAAGGVKMTDIDEVPVPNTSRGTESFKSGRADVAMSSLGGARLQQADAAVGGIKILPIPEGAEEAIAAVNPNYYVISMEPSAAMPGFDTPLRSLAYDFLLNASTETDADLVYAVTKALAENKDILVGVTGAYSGFSKEEMAKPYEGLTYHEGAIRYYKEVGLWPAE